MNKTNIPKPDLDNFLGQTLRDDLPPEVEARMNRRFLDLKRSLGRPEEKAEPRNRRLWTHGAFRKDILAFASVIMLVLGGVGHLGGDHGAWANSLERLKIVVTVSTSLHSATSMDCTVLKLGVGEPNASFRVRWGSTGVSRADMGSTESAGQTVWISNAGISPDPKWQPVVEFLTPAVLAQHVEEHYGLMHTERRNDAGQEEFLLVGSQHGQAVEIAVDPRTYLPKTLRKYSPDSDQVGKVRTCLMEVRFLWNRPFSGELLVPASPLGKRQVNE